MKLSMEAPKASESSAERAAIQAELTRGHEMATEGRTAWTDVLLYVFPEGEMANDVVMDDRTYSADVAKGAILHCIDELSELEDQLDALKSAANDAR